MLGQSLQGIGRLCNIPEWKIIGEWELRQDFGGRKGIFVQWDQ